MGVYGVNGFGEKLKPNKTKQQQQQHFAAAVLPAQPAGRPSWPAALAACRRRFHKIERGRESERGERERGVYRERRKEKKTGRKERGRWRPRLGAAAAKAGDAAAAPAGHAPAARGRVKARRWRAGHRPGHGSVSLDGREMRDERERVIKREN